MICEDKITGIEVRLGDAYCHSKYIYVIEFDSESFNYVGVDPFHSSDKEFKDTISIRLLLDNGKHFGNIFITPELLKIRSFVCKRCNQQYEAYFEKQECSMCEFNDLIKNMS